jgi:hypothetical protein
MIVITDIKQKKMPAVSEFQSFSAMKILQILFVLSLAHFASSSAIKYKTLEVGYIYTL